MVPPTASAAMPQGRADHSDGQVARSSAEAERASQLSTMHEINASAAGGKQVCTRRRQKIQLCDDVVACEVVVCILNLECGAHQSSTNECSHRLVAC